MARQGGLGQAQFLALIDQRRALQGDQQGEQCLGQFRRSVCAAEPAEGARHVVIGEADGRPVVGVGLQRRIVIPHEAALQTSRQQHHKGVARVQALAGRGIGAATFLLLREFAEHETALESVHPPADQVQRGDVLRQVRVAQVALQIAGVAPVIAAPLFGRHGWIVSEVRVMEIGPRHIQAKAIDPTRQPRVQHSQRRLAGVWITPVQLGLLAQKLVVVVLAARRLIGPGRATEHAQPVVGRGAVGLRIGPDIPVGLGSLQAAAQALHEPRMHIGGVAEHLVHHHLQAPRVGRVQQALEALEGPIVRVDTLIVRSVIAPVPVRRRMDRRQPDAVDAQGRNVVQLGQHPGQIAMPIAIAVEEAADVDVVENRALPPGGRHRSLQGSLRQREGILAT